MRIDWTGVSEWTSGMRTTVVRTNQWPGKFSGIGDFGEKIDIERLRCSSLHFPLREFLLFRHIAD